MYTLNLIRLCGCVNLVVMNEDCKDKCDRSENILAVCVIDRATIDYSISHSICKILVQLTGSSKKRLLLKYLNQGDILSY